MIDGKRVGRRSGAGMAWTAAVVVSLMITLVAPVGAGAQTPPDPTSSTTEPPTSTSSTTTSTTTTSTTTPPTTGPDRPPDPEDPPPPEEPPDETTTTTRPDPGGSPPALSDEEIDKLRSGVDSLTADELSLLERFLDTQSKVSEAQRELVRLTSQLQQLNIDLLKAVNQVREANNRYLDTKNRLDEAQAQLDSHRQRLRTAAVEAYIGGGKGLSTSAVLLRADTVDDLTKSRVYATSVASDERELIDRFEALKDEVGRLTTEAETERAAAAAARDRAADRQDDVRQQTELQRLAAQQQRQVLEDQVQVVAQIQRKRADYLARVAQQGHTSDSVEGILRKAQAGQPLPLTTTGIFTLPVTGARLTSSYGPRVSPLYGASSSHPGVDLAIAQGTPIRAPADGVVLMSEYYGGYGNCTIIDHGNSIGTLYGHQVQTLVRPGDIVTKGQIIGLVGTTGYSTGPHLHWEVRIQGQTIDPLSTLGAPP